MSSRAAASSSPTAPPPSTRQFREKHFDMLWKCQVVAGLISLPWASSPVGRRSLESRLERPMGSQCTDRVARTMVLSLGCPVVSCGANCLPPQIDVRYGLQACLSVGQRSHPSFRPSLSPCADGDSVLSFATRFLDKRPPAPSSAEDGHSCSPHGRIKDVCLSVCPRHSCEVSGYIYNNGDRLLGTV